MRREFRELKAYCAEQTLLKEAEREQIRQRQKQERQNRDNRNREIMQKLERSKQAVEAFQKRQKHEFTLKQEYRRLKEEDLKQLA